MDKEATIKAVKDAFAAPAISLKPPSLKAAMLLLNPTNMNIQELINNVRQWGVDRNITGANGKGTLLGQLTKTQEELTETRDAAIKSQQHEPQSLEGIDAWLDLRDGIGDTTVTLILASEMAGLRFEDCLQAAYDEIKGRTGKMENGVFIKDGK